MKWIKRIAITVGILLLVLAALPLFIKLDDYIPVIEKQVAEKLKEPVTIGKISFSTLPAPHITVDQINVGKSGDISVGKVTVTPDVFSLFGTPKILRSVELNSLVVTQKALDKIPLWAKADTGKESAVRVQSIKLENALLKLDSANFGPFDGGVRISPSGAPEEASIATQDGKLKALIKPAKADSYQIEASAKSWKPPIGPPIAIDELLIKGVTTTSSANFDQISAKLYGGSISGSSTVGWQQGLQVKGRLEVNQVELGQLVPLLSPGTNLSGRLNARPVFSAAAPAAQQLMNALRMSTPFDIRDGVLHGVDIHKAATNLVKQGSSGGATKFDQLSGHLDLQRGTYRFTQLKITSGALAADGNVSISPQKELAGRVNAKVSTGIGSAGIPLDVSGSVTQPMLLPTRAALAGAAAGTLLMPGVGTGIGIKAGEMIEGFFGKKKGGAK